MKLADFAGCMRLWKACPESQHGRAVLCQSPFRSPLKFSWDQEVLTEHKISRYSSEPFGLSGGGGRKQEALESRPH